MDIYSSLFYQNVHLILSLIYEAFLLLEKKSERYSQSLSSYCCIPILIANQWSVLTKMSSHVAIILPLQIKILVVYRNHPVRLSVHISHKHISSSTNKQILMKLYAAVVYNLSIWMKENNPGRKNIKEGNSREIIISAGVRYPLLFY